MSGYKGLGVNWPARHPAKGCRARTVYERCRSTPPKQRALPRTRWSDGIVESTIVRASGVSAASIWALWEHGACAWLQVWRIQHTMWQGGALLCR